MKLNTINQQKYINKKTNDNITINNNEFNDINNNQKDECHKTFTKVYEYMNILIILKNF